MITSLTEKQIVKLLNNIKRYEDLPDPYFMGWRSALDTIRMDIDEAFRGERSID